jgi:hypothetical protein
MNIIYVFMNQKPYVYKQLQRILRTYYTIFIKEFFIDGIVQNGNYIDLIPYDSRIDQKYLGFLIKRKS